MPDSDGKIRGIAVPSVPWHEEKQPNMLTKPGDLDRLLHHPWRELSDVETGARDADQMLWDKQTDEGPSALEKLRDKS